MAVISHVNFKISNARELNQVARWRVCLTILAAHFDVVTNAIDGIAHTLGYTIKNRAIRARIIAFDCWAQAFDSPLLFLTLKSYTCENVCKGDRKRFLADCVPETHPFGVNSLPNGHSVHFVPKTPCLQKHRPSSWLQSGRVEPSLLQEHANKYVRNKVSAENKK